MLEVNSEEVKKMIYKIIEKCLDVIRSNSNSFQNYINYRYAEHDVLLINKKYLKNKTYTVNGKLFFVTKCMESLDTIEEEYIYNDIKKTDVVVDIGANLGGFSIPISDMCLHVFAIEPLFTKELKNNIELNNIKNCTVIPMGLGDGITQLEYHHNIKKVQCVSLKHITKMVGGRIDFLKIDCEGGEWCIKENELVDINKIEMELHLFNNENRDDFLKMLKNVGFNIIIKKLGDKNYLVHARKKHLQQPN